jgi:hypothetical protein
MLSRLVAATLVAIGAMGAAPSLLASGTVQAQTAPMITATICGKSGSVHPNNISFTCNGYPLLGDLEWKTWGPATATAYGYLEWNLCKPDCAQGKIEKAPTEVELFNVKGTAFTMMNYTVWQKPVRLPKL